MKKFAVIGEGNIGVASQNPKELNDAREKAIAPNITGLITFDLAQNIPVDVARTYFERGWNACVEHHEKINE